MRLGYLTSAVPYYSVRAGSVEDIQASVKFASEKDLYLVTKNTGHDQCVSLLLIKAGLTEPVSVGQAEKARSRSGRIT